MEVTDILDKTNFKNHINDYLNRLNNTGVLLGVLISSEIEFPGLK